MPLCAPEVPRHLSGPFPACAWGSVSWIMSHTFLGVWSDSHVSVVMMFLIIRFIRVSTNYSPSQTLRPFRYLDPVLNLTRVELLSQVHLCKCPFQYIFFPRQLYYSSLRKSIPGGWPWPWPWPSIHSKFCCCKTLHPSHCSEYIFPLMKLRLDRR